MEKQILYTAPAIRVLALRYEDNFMVSTSGSIDPWTEDSEEIDF